MTLTQTLGRNIRAVRKARSLSQEQLALEVGMKRSYVSDLERGTRNPTIAAIARIALALEVEAWTLLMQVQLPEDATHGSPRSK